jgi:hypothetical protein
MAIVGTQHKRERASGQHLRGKGENEETNELEGDSKAEQLQRLSTAGFGF